MSADTFLRAVPPDFPWTCHQDLKDFDKVWIGQGKRTWPAADGRYDFSSSPLPVHFISVLFADSPVLTVPLMKSALNAMNMRNTSDYGTGIEVWVEGDTLRSNWRGVSPPRQVAHYLPDDEPSRGGIDRKLRLPGGSRRMFHRGRGVSRSRPVKKFLEAHMGLRMVVEVE